MRLSFVIRAALIAFTVTGLGLATAAYADGGAIRFNVLKAGFVVGGSAVASFQAALGPCQSAAMSRAESSLVSGI